MDELNVHNYYAQLTYVVTVEFLGMVISAVLSMLTLGMAGLVTWLDNKHVSSDSIAVEASTQTEACN